MQMSQRNDSVKNKENKKESKIIKKSQSKMNTIVSTIYPIVTVSRDFLHDKNMTKMHDNQLMYLSSELRCF